MPLSLEELQSLRREEKKKRKAEEDEEEVEKVFHKQIKLTGAVPIKKLVETAKRDRKMFHPLIPEPWFFVICVGPSECGKTTVLLNLLKSKDGYRGKFDRVFMFNPYAKHDKIYKDLKLEPERVFTKWTEDDLRKLLTEKNEWVEAWKDGDADIPPPTDLWIIDDSFGTDISSSFKQSVLDEVITVGRKCHINVWFISHRWKRQMSKMMRNQMTHGIFFEMPNRQEYEDLRDEICPVWLKHKQFDRMYAECTLKPKDFLFVNLKVDKHMRFSHNFDTLYVTSLQK